MQEAESLRLQVGGEQVHAGCIPARPVELATNPDLTGSVLEKRIGIVEVAALAA